MMVKITFTLVAAATLAGCVTSGQHLSQPVPISMEEASAFEQSLLAQELEPIELPTIEVYAQPVNKTEPCKLPSTPDQLERSNFRAYWDGDCKNGFAYGLGRDIAISDTHHFEEITIHKGAGDNIMQPSVIYNFVDNVVIYTVPGTKFPEKVQLGERIENSFGNFNAYQTLTVIEKNQSFSVHTATFDPRKFYVSSRLDKPITYKFSDYSAVPAINQSEITFTAEIIDSRTNTAGGVGIARYANGTVGHFKLLNGVSEPTLIPTSYTQHVSTKYQEIHNGVANANNILQRAQQMEREYLFKACSGKHSIDGLDMDTYTKICTWRDQFKEPYAEAYAKYSKQLDVMRQQAATVEQQRQIQHQQAIQQQMLQQQQTQQVWNQVNQASQQTQQITQSIMQNLNNTQQPQVQPLTPLGNNKITCYTVGNIMTCR